MARTIGRVDNFRVRIKRSVRNLKRLVRSHSSQASRQFGDGPGGRNVVNVVLASAIALSAISPSLPAVIAAYANYESKQVRPIADTQPTAPLAVDAQPIEGTAQALPESEQEQLDADRHANTVGKPKDRTPVTQIKDQRTTHDKVYVNADGTRTLIHSLQASGYKDASGAWKDVDVTLTQNDTTGKWESKANAWTVKFGGSNSTGIELTQGNDTLVMKPVGGAAVTPTVTGTAPNQVVTYRNVWQGIDLRYTVGGSELKESIIVKSRAAATTYAFDVTGNSFAADATRPGWFKLSGALGDFSVTAPTIATANAGVQGGAPTVTQTLDGTRVTVTLDSKWVDQQPTEAFPLVIDPTYYNVTNGVGGNYINYKENGFVCYAGQGCGNSTGNASGNMWRTIFLVDYPQLTGKYLMSAELNMTMYAPDGINYFGTTASRYITATHAGCDTGYNCVDASLGSSVQTAGSSLVNMDVTSIYRGLIAAGDYEGSLIVRGEESAGYESFKMFNPASTTVKFVFDALPTAPAIASGSPANGGVAVTTQPSFKITSSTDVDGDGITYGYVVGTSKTGPGSGITGSIGGVVADSGHTPSTQWTIPDNVLQDGTTYYWQPYAWDGVQQSVNNYGPVYSFKVDMRTGKDSTQAYDTVGPASVDLATGNLTTSAKSHSIAALGGSLGINLDYNSPQRSRPGLVAQYWNNTTMSGSPVITRVERNVDYDWASSSPYAGVVTSDNFYTRWSGFLNVPTTGTYTFGCKANDVFKLWVNGNLILDTWTSGCYNTPHWGSAVSLTAGTPVTVQIDYAEGAGAAHSYFYYKDAANNPQIVPSEWLQTGIRPVATPKGLIGRYFTDDGSHNFPSTDTDSRKFLTRTDTGFAFNWGTGAAAPNAPTDNFLVRWTGFFRAPQTGTYKFGGYGDDKLKVKTNGSTVVDTWSTGTTSSTVWASSGTSMTAGDTLPVTFEYNELTGGASVNFFVDGPGIDKALPIPANSLLTQSQVLPDGWNLGIDADGNLGYDWAYIGPNSTTLRDS